jgi:hypothetical protein
MRAVLFLSCLLFTINLAYGQNGTDIPKGVNKLVLSTDFNEKENMKALIKVLKNLDVPIQKADTLSNQIQTSPRNMDSYTYSLFFNVLDHKIVASATYNSNIGIQMYNMVINDVGRDVVTTKRKNSTQNKIFLKMKEIMIWIGGEKNIDYDFVN